MFALRLANNSLNPILLRDHNGAKAFGLELVNTAVAAPNIVGSYLPRQLHTPPHAQCSTQQKSKAPRK